MSEPEDGEAPAAPDAQPRRFYMDKPEEVADAQERYRRASTPPAAAEPSTPTAPSPAGHAAPPAAAEPSPPTAPAPATAPSSAVRAAPPAAPVVGPSALQRARLATAGAALALATAFFYPAIRDALDGEHRRGPLGRDGRALPAPPPRMYLLVNATPRGATVMLDGAEAGTTPLATDVDCVDGAPILVELAAPGYAAHTATVPCTPGGDAEVSPALKRDARRR